MKLLPNRPLTNIDLVTYAKIMKIPHFRGVYMRDSLPNKIRQNYECGIVNLDSSNGPGTHWTAYRKTKSKVIYFDSFGSFQPSIELKKYFNSNGSTKIFFNYNSYQNVNTVICGHLCLQFLIYN